MAKLISWNIDSLNAALTSTSARALLSQDVLKKLSSYDAEIIALQETKLPSEGPSPKHLELLSSYFLDYKIEWISSEPPAKKGYAGTMVLYKNNFSAKKEDAKLLTDGNRQRDAQTLCDYLCKVLKIAPVKVVVTKRTQPHRTKNGTLKSKTYGFYRPGAKTITIYDTTAIKQQQVSIKCFADTFSGTFTGN